LLTSARGAIFLKLRKTPRSQALTPQERRRGTYTQTHIGGLCRGGSDRISFHVCGEGGSGGRQGEKKWWEGDRRERENGEKQGGGERREDEKRERDGTCMGGKEVGGRGRWRGGRERRGEGGGVKQGGREHAKKGERWEEGKEGWRWDEGNTSVREEGEGKGGS